MGQIFLHCFRACAGAASLWTLILVSVHAQSPLASGLDAGAVRQQIEQQRELVLPHAVRPERVTPPPEIQPRDGVTVAVRAFRFAGNTLLQADQLDAALAGFVGRELDFAGLQRASDAVAAAYRDAGWIVRVYLPEQDISAGVVTLQVVEARFAGLRFEGDASRLVQRSQIEAFFTARQAQAVDSF